MLLKLLHDGGVTMITIDNKELFIEKLKTGICFFTGAGFSVLADDDGKSLPTSHDLAKELREKFKIDDIFGDDLAYISEQCPQNELDAFLRAKFKVTKYNKLYDVLNQINIKTFVTTNIDNILQRVVSNGDRYYIYNMREYGASMNKPNELYFIPLHGNVLDCSTKLYFGKLELTQVSSDNNDLFNAMYTRLKKESIIFIGYSFSDPGVLGVVTKLLDSGCHDIWVQCCSSDQKNITFFKSKGCNIIEGDTEDLLKWIKCELDKITVNIGSTRPLDGLDIYKIPSLSEVTAIPTTDYFQKGTTDWYPILQNSPYERKEVSQSYNDALKLKNIIIIGERFTGKTTMLMQLALKVTSPNKFFIDTPRLSEAEYICKKIGSANAWVFIKNCTADVTAYKYFAQQKNINVIGTSNEYQYETIRHLIDGEIKYKCINISDLSRDESLAMYNKLPNSIKQPKFKYKEPRSEDEKYSLFEFIGQNVKNAFTKTHTKSILEMLLKQNKRLFDVIALTTYLSDNYSALSYNVLALIYDIPVHPDAFQLISESMSYLRGLVNIDENDATDYYLLRSKLFATNIRNLMLGEFKDAYATVIESFIKKVPSYYILHFDIFRRKAFDADLFYKLFSYEKCNELFTLLYNSEQSCYTLQQWALCRMKFSRYKEAFADIDLALSIAPNNFSIKNSQAIILFEANKYDKTEKALPYLKQAMEILKKCYNNDKRKTYHCQKFAEFAIILKKNHNCDEYIADAKKWIAEIAFEQGENISRKTTHLQQDLENL